MNLLQAISNLNPNSVVTFDGKSYTVNGVSVDVTRTEVLKEAEAVSRSELIENVRLEVERRILEVVSTNTQINLSAAAAAGTLSTEQQQAFVAGVEWINAVRQAGKLLVTNATDDYTSDIHWPAVPTNAQALAQEF